MANALLIEPKKRRRKPKKTAPLPTPSTTRTGRVNKWDVSGRDWSQYHKYQTPEIRQKLLGKYVPLVRNVATRMAMGFPKSVELSDLVNTGVIGLIEAFGNFDTERGVKFET